jgi:recombination protein RecR
MKYPHHLEKVLRMFNKLPGVGRKTAERYAFDLLLEWKKHEIDDFSDALSELQTTMSFCSECGALQEGSICPICSDDARRKELVCIVASPREVFAMEATGEYRGSYHVLGALLSPLDGRGEELLNIAKIIHRIQTKGVKEVILALDSTLEGDATALYLKQELEGLPISISRLAFGIPVGSSLEYVDGGTLARAFLGRAHF